MQVRRREPPGRGRGEPRRPARQLSPQTAGATAPLAAHCLRPDRCALVPQWPGGAASHRHFSQRATMGGGAALPWRLPQPTLSWDREPCSPSPAPRAVRARLRTRHLPPPSLSRPTAAGSSQSRPNCSIERQGRAGHGALGAACWFLLLLLALVALPAALLPPAVG